MKSMTGYAYMELQEQSSHYILSLKSYNNRFLDVIIYLPPFLNQIEPKIREYLSKKIKRGRVEFSLKLQELQETVNLHLDKHLMNTYVNAFKQIMTDVDIKEKISLSNILRVDGVLKAEKNYDVDRYWNQIENSLEELFRQFDETRIKEGEHTLENIRSIVDSIARHIETIRTHIPEIEVKIKDQVIKRFKETLGSEIEESRMLAEVAVLLIKYDIREEVVRLESHIASFRSILEEEGAVGKKLDFICQELNREINTIGSKSLFLDVNQSVISVKDHIETIREQLRNVE